MTAGPKNSNPSPRQPGKPHILVIDDEPGICGLLTVYFNYHGLQVSTALDLQKACDLLQQGRYNLVIADWNLAGTEGLDVITVSKALYPGVPVVVYTGIDEVNLTLVREALKGRADAIVQKRGSLQELSAQVFRLLQLPLVTRVSPPAP